MRIDSLAHYALVGALAVSLACARNSEDTDTGATGSVTTTDTGAAVTVSPDTGPADTAGTEIIQDTSRGTQTDLDSTAGAGAPVRAGTTDSARMTIDTTDTSATSDSAPLQPDTANVNPGPGWPEDTTQGGWSTPPDSGR
jgi:hypothetical protein